MQAVEPRPQDKLRSKRVYSLDEIRQAQLRIIRSIDNIIEIIQKQRIEIETELKSLKGRS